MVLGGICMRFSDCGCWTLLVLALMMHQVGWIGGPKVRQAHGVVLVGRIVAVV